jgi:hypothetical protein
MPAMFDKVRPRLHVKTDTDPNEIHPTTLYYVEAKPLSKSVDWFGDDLYGLLDRQTDIDLPMSEKESSLRSNSCLASQEIFRLLWNPGGPLPYSQEPDIGPYPEPLESSPHLHTL